MQVAGGLAQDAITVADLVAAAASQGSHELAGWLREPVLVRPCS